MAPTEPAKFTYDGLDSKIQKGANIAALSLCHVQKAQATSTVLSSRGSPLLHIFFGHNVRLTIDQKKGTNSTTGRSFIITGTPLPPLSHSAKEDLQPNEDHNTPAPVPSARLIAQVRMSSTNATSQTAIHWTTTEYVAILEREAIFFSVTSLRLNESSNDSEEIEKNRDWDHYFGKCET